MHHCNICGHETFAPGPNGRRSVNGKLPQCAKCGSLERHRAIRALLLDLDVPNWPRQCVLQFSADHSVDPGWWRSSPDCSFELSVYGQDNSLDLMNIDRADGAYSLVVCNHVLEHVPDDRRSLREIARVLRPDGVAVVSFPDPMRQAATRDWGFPDWNDHGHYRRYGRDVIDKMREELPGTTVLELTAVDPVTGVDDLVYLLCRSAEFAFRQCERLPSGRARVAHAPTPS